MDVNKKIMKKRFAFGKPGSRTCTLVLRLTYTNILLTMIDRRMKVVVGASSGMFSLTNSKRHKKAPQIIEELMSFINYYLRLYKIDIVVFKLKNNVPFFTTYVLKELNYYLINVTVFALDFRLPHNGPRGRAVKRRGR